MPRSLLALGPLLGLLACNPPLRGGLYLITVSDVRDDSCELWAAAWDYEDDGSIWWDDRETMVVETTSGQWFWHWDGDELTNQDESVEAWEDDCDALFYEDSVGTIDDPNHWSYTQAIELQLDGACVGYNLDMLPCTVEIDSAAERVGD
jgi:hypothetical protein